jgi:hypothetical protein
MSEINQSANAIGTAAESKQTHCDSTDRPAQSV